MGKDGRVTVIPAEKVNELGDSAHNIAKRHYQRFRDSALNYGGEAPSQVKCTVTGTPRPPGKPASRLRRPVAQLARLTRSGQQPK